MEKQPAKEIRKHLISFRMTESELAKFHENLDRSELAASDFLRFLACETPIKKARRRPRADEKALAKTLGSLLAIGRNINQIAHAINIAKQKADGAAVASVLQIKSGEMATALAQLAQTRAAISNALSYDTGSE